MHTTKGEQTDPSKLMYEKTGLTNNTHKIILTTDIEQYFVDDGEKEYNIIHSKDFTEKMIQRYPIVFTVIGKLESTVKIDLQDGGTPYQASPW